MGVVLGFVLTGHCSLPARLAEGRYGIGLSEKVMLHETTCCFFAKISKYYILEL